VGRQETHADPGGHFNGVLLRDKALHIGYLPGRKRPQLYFVEGATYRPLASFKNEADAIEVGNFLLAVAESEFGQ
jgi:hypothetical protein